MTWTVRLHNIPEDKIEDLLEYCSQAELKDPTFRVDVEERKNGKIRYVIIKCESKDQAFKRGVLFHSRFNCFFEVEWV